MVGKGTVRFWQPMGVPPRGQRAGEWSGGRSGPLGADASEGKGGGSGQGTRTTSSMGSRALFRYARRMVSTARWWVTCSRLSPSTATSSKPA